MIDSAAFPFIFLIKTYKQSVAALMLVANHFKEEQRALHLQQLVK